MIGYARKMNDLPNMMRGTGDNHAAACRAVDDLAAAQIDQHMAVLRFSTGSGAQNVARNCIIQVAADIVAARIFTGAVSPFIRMHKVVDQAETVKNMINEPAAVRRAAAVQFLESAAVGIRVVLTGRVINYADPLFGVIQPVCMTPVSGSK